MFDKIKETFFDVRVAWTLMILFLFSMFIYLGSEDAFKSNDDKKTHFYHFGPDTSGNTKFFNMPLNNWEKISSVYFFCFLINFMLKYYEGIMDYVIYSTVWNPAYKDPITISKPLTYLFLLSDNIIWWLQNIIIFYIMSIKQFQFLTPVLVGTLVAKWPYSILRINSKNFS